MVKKLQKKYALSERGAKDLILGCIACAVQNLTFMFPVCLLFMLVVATGYVAGIANKLVYNFDGVVYLYVLDLVLVSTDIALFARNRRLERRGEGSSARVAEAA